MHIFSSYKPLIIFDWKSPPVNIVSCLLNLLIFFCGVLSPQSQHSKAVECCSSGGQDRSRGFGLTGLHTCGDLAATLLDVFLRAPHCRYLASVACCYMKLTTTVE